MNNEYIHTYIHLYDQGILHYIVPKSKLQLDINVDHHQHLSCYTFGTHTAKHYFCKTCGIAPFYVPRSNPDGYSINVKCLDPYDPNILVIEKFDGQNWEKGADQLSHLSKEK
jgi:hypothetical protein